MKLHMLASDKGEGEGSSSEDDSDQPNDANKVRLYNRHNVQYLCLSLRGWCFMAGLIYLATALLILAMFLLQNFGLIRLNRMWVPVTQAVVLEVKAGEVPYSWHGRNLGGNAELKSSCSLLETYGGAFPGDRFLKPLVLNNGSLDIRICLLLVFSISAFFAIADCIDEGAYYTPLEMGRCHLSHFVEASFSLPVMVLIMCATLGVTDTAVLQGAACSAWCSMLFGQLAEVLSQGGSGSIHVGGIKTFEYHVIAHFAHWVSFVSAVTVLFANMSVYNMCVASGDGRGAQFIVGSVAVILVVVLLVLFGLIQTYVLYARAHEFGVSNNLSRALNVRSAFHSEFATIIVSLGARLFLGLLIFVGGAV